MHRDHAAGHRVGATLIPAASPDCLLLTRQNINGFVTVAVLLWLGVISWVAWKVFDWYFDRFILINKRVMVVNGIITRRVAMMPLLRLADMKYEQSALGRLEQADARDEAQRLKLYGLTDDGRAAASLTPSR